MPLYEYSCLECDTDFERNVPIKDRDRVICTLCGNFLNRSIKFNGAVYAPTSTSGGMKV